MPAALELAEQHFIGKRLLDIFLNEAGHGPCAHLLVIAMLDEPLAGILGELDGDVPVSKLCFKLKNELLHHLGNNLRR